MLPDSLTSTHLIKMLLRFSAERRGAFLYSTSMVSNINKEIVDVNKTSSET
jgi:hypothetical protein